jgi:hypothetical protein
MNRTRTHINKKLLSLLSLVVALGVVATATATAAISGGIPPQLGKICGSVKGASWRFEGQTGTHYSVVAKTSAMCTAGMKFVGGLTKQKPHRGAFGPNTLTGPRGFQCILTLQPAHAGYCGTTGPNSAFYWAPRLKK